MGKKSRKKAEKQLKKKLRQLRKLAAERVAEVFDEDGRSARERMPDVFEAIGARRSIKRFRDRAISRADIERLLDAAALAPNHRMTEPWRFCVLGPRARRAYGDALGVRKAKKLDDKEAAAQVRAKVAAENESLPAVIAVAMKVVDDPEVQREDYAATFMAVQNLTLAATALGLGTHIKTGAVMDDPAARAAVGVKDDERIVAVVNLGEPEELPSEKRRTPATELTRWLE